ncbi:unnamed protein product [marine sediment metagenome]|uniref:Uncharacterized protein n=1 Tax=marine sediment metagenome TaxID=412755 RepID=X1QUX4_9ZZZZ
MPLLNYTTKVPVSRTISQIQGILVQHHAKSIMMDYDNNGRIESLSFLILTASGEIPIRLPVDTASTQKVLREQYENREGVSRSQTEEAHAYRVSWRTLKDWIEAQMSLLETGMVKMEQIFLPYVVTKTGQTVFEVIEKKNFLLEQGNEHSK